MHYGIKDGKVWDRCSDLRNKRMFDNGVPMEAEFYIEKDDRSYTTGDSYNQLSEEITKDSPSRIPVKTELQLLQEEVADLKSRLIILEDK